MTDYKKFHDEACARLAEVFLKDRPELATPDHQDELAGMIQEAIENWFSDQDSDE